MAQRYGGKYSPGPDAPATSQTPGKPAYRNARVDPAGARSNVLFIPPIILAALSLNEGAMGLAVGLVGAGLLLLGAWVLRDGLRAEAEFNARRVARRPAFPRKMFAAGLTGLGVGLAAWMTAPGVIAPVVYGLAVVALHLGAFGLDPMKDKGMEGIDTHQQDRVARVVDEAESLLKGMTEAVARAGDRQVTARVERFQDQVREMIRTVEEDPRDLTAARKYLGVYLMGARDASVKFADLYSRTRDVGARSDYMMLLTDLEESFDKKTQKLLLDSGSDLTVEIEVLRERLQREGVRL